MKTTALWDQYLHYTRDLTVTCRYYGFAVGAITWAFPTDGRFTAWTFWTMSLLILFFVLDILQNLAGALTVKLFTQRQEAAMWRARQSIDGDVMKPRWVDRPAFALFMLKIACLLLAFVIVGVRFIDRAMGS